MKRLIFLMLISASASAQTYDFDLTMDGSTYAGDFSYTLATDTISNVDVFGNGINFTIDSAPLRGTQWSNSYVWFLGPQHDTIGFQLIKPLGGRESTFTDVYLDVNGVQSWCDPGPSTCVMSLTQQVPTALGARAAPEIGSRGAAAALTLLACCLLIAMVKEIA